MPAISRARTRRPRAPTGSLLIPCFEITMRPARALIDLQALRHNYQLAPVSYTHLTLPTTPYV